MAIAAHAHSLKHGYFFYFFFFLFPVDLASGELHSGARPREDHRVIVVDRAGRSRVVVLDSVELLVFFIG